MERYCLLSRFILSARVNQYHDQLAFPALLRIYTLCLRMAAVPQAGLHAAEILVIWCGDRSCIQVVTSPAGSGLLTGAPGEPGGPHIRR